MLFVFDYDTKIAPFFFLKKHFAQFNITLTFACTADYPSEKFKIQKPCEKDSGDVNWSIKTINPTPGLLLTR